MSLNAASLKLMAAKGLSAQDIVEIAEAMEADKPRSKAAQRQARYRAREKAKEAANDVTDDVTGDVTPPLKENSKPLGSEANASVGKPTDPVKELFDIGVSILTANDHTEKQARSLIGKWRKERKDGEVLTALVECRTKAISNPVEWLTKRLEPRRYISSSGYEYRGDLDAVIRESERRADWGTYWKAKGDQSGQLQHSGSS